MMTQIMIALSHPTYKLEKQTYKKRTNKTSSNKLLTKDMQPFRSPN